jgi:hypothetical protein
VIDLIVALSYPDRFVVERTARGGGGARTYVNDPFLVGWAFGYPYWYDDFYYSPYYYTPFGYSRFGYGGYYDAVFVGGGGGDVSADPRPSGAGRVVNGQGYTRVQPRETSVADNGSIITRNGRSSGDAGSSSSSSSSASGSSSTASSSGGYTGGSTSGDTGRTAQPR